jgi:hypothetical protein
VAGGATEKEYKRHGHDLGSAVCQFEKQHSAFDSNRVSRVIATLPRYVENRYSPEQPGRIETGHIVMGCQYIAGEVMRQVTGFTIRSAGPEPLPRVYPPLA